VRLLVFINYLALISFNLEMQSEYALCLFR